MVAQAFQKLVLQWRPELDAAVPVNVFDDLSARGLDGWLDAARSVPAAADTPDDSDLAWEDVVARHIALLAAYPALSEAYASTPNALELYGLPMSIKDYGGLLSLRLQRAVLQVWTVDAGAGSAPVERVVVANGGDMAKEAGLWTPDASAPSPLPEGTP